MLMLDAPFESAVKPPGTPPLPLARPWCRYYQVTSFLPQMFATASILDMLEDFHQLFVKYLLFH